MLTKTSDSQHKTAYSPGTKMTTKPLATVEFPPVANVSLLSCYMPFNMIHCQHKAIIWQLHLCI